MISTEDTVDEEEILRDFDAEAKLIVETETLPKKSVDQYKLIYDAYQKWKTDNQSSLSRSEETNLVVYFKDLSKKLKPSTLWSIWSMLKKTLNTRNNIDIGRFKNLKSLVKNNSKGYKPKKSLVFKWEEIMEFINNASDHTHLVSKVILVFGICGALRCDELTKLKLQDVEELTNKYLVSIHDTKNDIPRQFIIGQLFYEKVKKYTSMRLKESFTDRYFVQYHNGKIQLQVIGRNKIGDTPHSIASYLNLPNPKLYTGHCFRRSGAILLSNSGANTTMLKQLGGWKSASIAQGYVENSMKNRERIYENIVVASTPIPNYPRPSTSSSTNDCSAEVIAAQKEMKPADAEKEGTNFYGEFDINDEALAKIEEQYQPEVHNQSPKKILVARNRKSPPPTHFLRKPPVKVFLNHHERKSENHPPQNESEVVKTRTYHTKSKVSSTDPVKTNPSNVYENCVFHGNIVNNFYYSCDHGKNNKN